MALKGNDRTERFFYPRRKRNCNNIFIKFLCAIRLKHKHAYRARKIHSFDLVPRSPAVYKEERSNFLLEKSFRSHYRLWLLIVNYIKKKKNPAAVFKTQNTNK